MNAAAKPTNPDFPSQDQLRIYGDFTFLAFRSPHHRTMSVANLHEAFQTPILLGQYRIFRFEDIPRGLFTWAWFSADAEQKYVSGQSLDPQDWRSGDRLWIIDLIAPYRGLTASMVRWIMVPGNFSERRFFFRRVKNGHDTRRIVGIDFATPENKARVWDQDAFLAQRDGAA